MAGGGFAKFFAGDGIRFENADSLLRRKNEICIDVTQDPAIVFKARLAVEMIEEFK